MVERNPNPAVKFVDRRRLDDDGEMRPDAPPEPAVIELAAPAPVPTVPPDAAGSVIAADGPAPAAEPVQTVKFEQVIQSLVAPVQMILSGQAGAVSPEEALAHLNFTIEAVELLERKTRGHLSPAEAQYLKSVGGSLKMVYMQLMKPPAVKG